MVPANYPNLHQVMSGDPGAKEEFQSPEISPTEPATLSIQPPPEYVLALNNPE